MSSGAVEKRGSSATVKACDSCRRRKRRCVWAEGAQGCTPCLNLKETCTTTHVRKQRAKPQRRNRIADYENRIQRLEALLQDRSDAQPQLQEQPLQPAQSSDLLSTWVDNLRGELESNPPVEPPNPEDLLENYEGVLETDEPQSASMTSGSAVVQTTPGSSFPQSLSGYEPSTELQEDAAFLQSSAMNPDLLNNAPGYAPPLPAHTECDSFLPPPGLATSLLKEFLIDFNTAFPLYRPYVIAEHLRICYIGASDGSAVAWVSAYVVFGIAHRLRAMSAEATPQDNEFADIYLTRCLQSISGLLLAPASLGVVQCLLGVATLIQTSSQPTPHALFVSTALRMAQSLAYNDDLANITDPDQDIEQQRRVFWFAFLKDTEESILSNTPTAQLRGDIATNRPEDNPADATGTVTAAEGSWRVNIFNLRVQLASLQAEAIEHILSVKARTSTQDMVATICALFTRLQVWRNHEIFRISAERLAQLLYRSDLVHVLVLEASYFALAFRLHSVCNRNLDTRINPFSIEGLTRISEQNEHAAYEDARRLLSLLTIAPQGDVGVCWQAKKPIIAALVTALAFYAHNSSGNSPSPSDMGVFHSAVRVVTALWEKSQDVELQHAQNLCMRLLMKVETGERIKWLLEKTEGEESGQPTYA